MVASQETKVYRLNPAGRARFFVVWALLFCLFVVPMVIAGRKQHEPGLIWLTVGLALATAAFPFMAARSMRLIISAEGVEFDALHAQVRTPWSNIAGIRLDPGFEGLITKEPLHSRLSDRLTLFRTAPLGAFLQLDDENRRLIAEHRFIPLGYVAFWLHHGDLAEQIVRHAPWLADAMTKLKRPGGMSETKKVLFGILMIVLFGIGVGLSRGPAWGIIFFNMISYVILGTACALGMVLESVNVFTCLRARQFKKAGTCVMLALGHFVWFLLALVHLFPSK